MGSQVENKTVKPLFIPLKTEHYEQFLSGEKWAEYRPFGPRWNHKTCYPGRPVTISKGYGVQNRCSGFITMVDVDRHYATRPEFIEIYGDRVPQGICIGIDLVYDDVVDLERSPHITYFELKKLTSACHGWEDNARILRPRTFYDLAPKLLRAYRDLQLRFEDQKQQLNQGSLF